MNKQVRGQSEDVRKEIKLVRKEIEKQLEDRLGLLVNKPKQNFGSTNDGNTARKFFNNVDIVSEITGNLSIFLTKLLNITQKITNHVMQDKRLIKVGCKF